MKKVLIFEDGKLGRGSKAKLLKRGNKRVLIEFKNYNHKTESEEVLLEWFTLFIPFYATNKKKYKNNNNRKSAKYCNKKTNQFYSDTYQSEKFKDEMRECLESDYFNSLLV